MADSMQTGEMEDGVPRLNTEETIFKLIWVQCCLFVLWPPKGERCSILGLPATNCNYPQTVQPGTLTRKPALQRFDRQLLVMIIGLRRVQLSKLQKQLTKLRHCKQERVCCYSQVWLLTYYSLLITVTIWRSLPICWIKTNRLQFPIVGSLSVINWGLTLKE